MSNFTTDPTVNLAVVLQDVNEDYPPVVASFSVSAQGEFVSTNTIADMPELPSYWWDSPNTAEISLDYSGKYLAVAVGAGVQLYHFAGAAPVTPFGEVVGNSGYITGLRWDSAGHLFAQNGATGQMLVYEVTAAGLKELAGSGVVIPMAGQIYPYSYYTQPPDYIVRSR